MIVVCCYCCELVILLLSINAFYARCPVKRLKYRLKRLAFLRQSKLAPLPKKVGQTYCTPPRQPLAMNGRFSALALPMPPALESYLPPRLKNNPH